MAQTETSAPAAPVSSTAHALPSATAAEPLRLLLVTPRYFPYMGGVENHVYQVARRLVRAGVDVTVLTTDPAGQWPESECIEGVKLQRVRAYPADRDYHWAPALRGWITPGRWDLVHIQSYHTFVAPLAMQAAHAARCPYLVTFHGGGHSSRLRHGLRQVQWTLLRPWLAGAARLVATAAFEIPLFSRALRLPADRFVYIPNGSDLPAHSQPAAATDPNLLISIGRLERYKGHQRVIAALPYVLAQRPNARLWIAGEGPYADDLRAMAGRLGVADRVDIRGIAPADRGELASGLSRAALVMLLSEYETHPMAILEAMALGRPVLVADTSGLRELAERGYARSVPLHSPPSQTAAAILQQLATPLYPPALALPTWDDCAAQLLALYTTLVPRLSCAS